MKSAIGLPYWVVISLAATLGVAVFTAIVVHKYWPETERAAAGPADRDRERL